jgi:hypothetical protein
MMRELRDDPNTNALYKGIVRLAILQGTYQSAISIKNVIPVEDYASHITPIISSLQVDDELRAFATSNEFQRNEWQDNDVVPIVEPRFAEEFRKPEEEDLPRKFQGLFVMVGKGENQRKVPGPFPTIKVLGVNTQKRDLLFINTKYQAKASNYDVIKVPRAIPINKEKLEEGKIDVDTGLEITNQTYAEKIKKGDTSLRNYYGYQKVKYADGSPVVASYDGEGNPVYVYKFINLHGDGMYATEYYGDGRPSIFNNGSQKNVKNVGGTLISNEIPDQDIINYYGGESVPLDEADPITATIEKESENVVSLKIEKGEIKQVSTVEREKTKSQFESTLADGTKVTKTGYKLIISEYPNVSMYITKSVPTDEGVVEKGSWYVEEVTTSKTFPTSSRTLSDILTDVKETINKQLRLDGGRKILESIGFVSSQPSTSVVSFDALTEFTPERKQEIITNFATKHKMTEEQAKNYINEALQKDAQTTINKLKECY